MSPPGRSKGESRKAQPEGTPASPPGRLKGESRTAQRRAVRRLHMFGPIAMPVPEAQRGWRVERFTWPAP